MKKFLKLLVLAGSLYSFSANAAAVPEFKLTIKNHKFTPQNIEIPAGQKVKFVIENQDKTIEEFDSNDLSREKIVGGGKTAELFVGPLKKGVYKFRGEFNEKTAHGTVTVK